MQMTFRYELLAGLQLRAEERMALFRQVCNFLGMEECKSEDACLLASREIGKEKLILQLEPYGNKISFLGELDNPSPRNTMDFRGAEGKKALELIKTLYQLIKINEQMGTNYGWKTLL